jgi:hypothetical protein
MSSPCEKAKADNMSAQTALFACRIKAKITGGYPQTECKSEEMFADIAELSETIVCDGSEKRPRINNEPEVYPLETIDPKELEPGNIRVIK